MEKKIDKQKIDYRNMDITKLDKDDVKWIFINVVCFYAVMGMIVAYALVNIHIIEKIAENLGF